MLAPVKISASTASQLLLLIINPDHPTLDPRITRTQARCINIVKSCLSAESALDASYKALCVVLENDTYPPCVFEALCRQPKSTSMSYATVLLHMIRHCRPSETIVSSMLSRGADPNQLLPEDTILGFAVKNRASKSIIALLLKHGADPDLSFTAGNTPREWAKALDLDYMTEMFNANQGDEFVEVAANALEEETLSRAWFPIRLGLSSLPFGSQRKAS